jgi:hypothetical protein
MENRFGKLARRWAAAFAVVMAGFGGNASALLLDRGPAMVYDTVLNITWTRQAGDGVLRQHGFAAGWALFLEVDGISGWRLPEASLSFDPLVSIDSSPVDCSTATEAACRDNEMGYMFYYNLGGSFGADKTGDQTAVGSQVLTGIQDGFYWSNTLSGSHGYWAFDFNGGDQTLAIGHSSEPGALESH